MLRDLLLWTVFISSVFVGCTASQSDTQKTLSLSLVSGPEGFKVSDYRVLDSPFQESQQQGLYQVHLKDKEGTILRKISFEKIDLPKRQGDKRADFYITLPLEPHLDRVLFYQLDGSSGHYQLKTDSPLLDWKLPKALRNTIRKSPTNQ